MNVYRANDISYRVANRNDEEALKTLLSKNAMDSWVNITLQKESSYFDSADLMGKSMTVIAYKTEDEQTVIGMYACTLFEIFF